MEDATGNQDAKAEMEPLDIQPHKDQPNRDSFKIKEPAADHAKSRTLYVNGVALRPSPKPALTS